MDELLQENQDLIEAAVDRAGAQFGGVEDELEKRLLAFLKRFATKGGKYERDVANKKLLSMIDREVRSLADTKKLTAAMDDLFTNFDQLGENLATFHKQRNGFTIGAGPINNARQAVADQTAFSMTEAGYSSKFADPVRRALYSAVNFGASVGETERQISMLVRGQGDGKGGMLQSWVGQVSRDALNQFEGHVHAEVADKFELTHLHYVGHLVRDSRSQCRRWVEQEFIALADLEAEIRWAFRYGSGMIPGTNKTNFIVRRGGYNCIHTAYPTRDPNA